MNYNEWHSLYLTLYKRNLKPKTSESYARLHALLSPTLGQLDLSSITPDHIQAALVAIEDSAGSRQAQLAFTLLRASFARAVRSKHLKESPVDAIDKPKHHSAKGRAIRGTDWELLRPVILAQPAFALAAFAGLRRGELLGLLREDIDLAAGIIHVHRQLVRVGGRLVASAPKSEAGIRDVPILPELLPVLQSACRLLHPKARVVPIAPETLDHRWRAAQEAADIQQPYRLHDLRHTYATRLIAAGCNINAVQYLLGHSSYQLTADTYTHLDGFDAAQAVRRVFASLH